jgi:predicted metal-dependent hydrolase
LNKYFLIFLIIIAAFMVSCSSNERENRKQFTDLLQTHLNAVSEKNIEKLITTLPPDSNFLFILPNSSPTKSSKDFIQFHKEWFKDTLWTFETKILEANVGEIMGIALVEAFYKEPERNGKPYFNKMSVSYALKKIEGKWYVIKDHASSIDKTSE